MNLSFSAVGLNDHIYCPISTHPARFNGPASSTDSSTMRLGSESQPGSRALAPRFFRKILIVLNLPVLGEIEHRFAIVEATVEIAAGDENLVAVG
jgi:hypothetical protein